jgi:ribosomal protein S18 acetylase RimI-like enzyme
VARGARAGVWLSSLSRPQRAAVDALKATCDRHDGIDQPLHLGDECPLRLHEVDGALVGVATLQIGEPLEACLLVHPAHRRRGIGRLLLEGVKAECRRRDEGLLLTCEDRSESGKRFAEAVGARYRSSEYALELAELPAERAWPELIELREVGLADVAEFIRVGAAAFGDLEVFDREARVRQGMRAGRHRYYLGVLGGRPMAVIRTSRGPEPVYVTHFGVLPELQGRGHGRQILTRVVRALAAEGHSPIRIEVATHNPGALGLYRSCGFRELAAYAYYDLDPSQNGCI